MKKNINIKIASAEDILNYLRSTAVDGISKTTKKDVARHFGYKSSNGNGFLSNFKLLEEKGLITDISSSSEKVLWKVDMETSLSNDVVKKNKNIVQESAKNPLANVNLEYLTPIEFAGRKYIPLISLAKALGIDRHPVYNAASSSNRLVYPYTRSIPVDEDKKPNTKKSIEVEGLSFLFDRLKKHVNQKTIDAVINYVNSEEYKSQTEKLPSNIKVQDTVEKKSSIVQSNAKEHGNTVSNKVKLDKKNTHTDLNENLSSNEQDLNKTQTSDYEQISLVDNITGDFNDSSEMLAMLDGILNILSEHTGLKTNLKILEEENISLKKKIEALKLEGHRHETESFEYHNLKAENEKLKTELEKLSSANNQILSKANMIKKYILENNASL